MEDEFLTCRTKYDQDMQSLYGGMASKPYGRYFEVDKSIYPPNTNIIERFCRGCESEEQMFDNAYATQVLPSGLDISQYRTAYDQNMQAIYGPLAAAPYGPYVERDWSLYYPALPPATSEGFSRKRKRTVERYSPCKCTNINLNRNYF